MILVSIASLIGYNAKAGRSHGPWGLGLLWALESSSALVSVSGWGIWSSGLSASGREGLGAVWLAVPGLELVAGWQLRQSTDRLWGSLLTGGEEVVAIDITIVHTLSELNSLFSVWWDDSVESTSGSDECCKNEILHI